MLRTNVHNLSLNTSRMVLEWLAFIYSHGVLNINLRIYFKDCSFSGRFLLQVIGHRSLFYQYRKYPKHLLTLVSQKLTLGLIRPKKIFLGLRLAFKRCLGLLSVLVKP